MLRVTGASLCSSCQRVRLLRPSPSAPACTAPPPGPRLQNQDLQGRRPENQALVASLYQLSVDVRKVRQSKAWVLSEDAAYVSETAALLTAMGADGPAVARILESHPEAVLVRPEEAAAQRDLWTSVCPNRRDLMGIIEKFPASFFTASRHQEQRDNIRYLQSLSLNRRLIGRLMASSPHCFSRPVGLNQEVIHTLRETYLELGGREDNVQVWLHKLLSQNPSVLLRPVQSWRDSLGFLREQGFSAPQLLGLVSGLRACVAELRPDVMGQALAYVECALDCSGAELRALVLRCPAVLLMSPPTLLGRFQGLMDLGLTAEQVRQAPCVLELTTHMVLYRVHKLKSSGYDVRSGSLDVIVGDKKVFEKSCLHLRAQRPLYDPVAPLRSAED